MPNTAPDAYAALRATTAAHLVDVLADGMTADCLAPHLACSEADAVADLLSAHGRHDEAEMWLDFHADQDDEGDLHHARRGNAAAYR